MISTIFGKLLGLIYSIVADYGVSIILFTLFVKLLLLPLSIAQVNSTKNMSKVQPEVKKLQEKYKNDKETLNVKTMELYKEYKINPLAGCLPLVIQLPIIFGLFAAMRDPLKYVFAGDTVAASAALNKGFLWISDLGSPDFLGPMLGINEGLMAGLPGILPIIAAVTTFFQMKASGGGAQENPTMKSMAYTMPLMILFMGRTLASGLMLYWIVGNIFQIGQQYVQTHMGLKGETK